MTAHMLCKISHCFEALATPTLSARGNDNDGISATIENFLCFSGLILILKLKKDFFPFLIWQNGDILTTITIVHEICFMAAKWRQHKENSHYPLIALQRGGCITEVRFWGENITSCGCFMKPFCMFLWGRRGHQEGWKEVVSSICSSIIL